MSLTRKRFSRNCVRESDTRRVPGFSGARDPAETTVEASRGRHPGFSSFKVLSGGLGNLALSLGATGGHTIPSITPHDVRPLSLSARIAIALHLFRGYCKRRGLNHPETDRFVEHLWEFIALPVDGSGFKAWVKREPPLTHTGLGCGFPTGFESVLKAAGVSAEEFRQVLECITGVLYSSMYAAADEEGSRRYLLELASVAEAAGVEWPDMNCFAGSNWSDSHGWGQRPSAQDLAEWRRAGRGSSNV